MIKEITNENIGTHSISTVYETAWLYFSISIAVVVFESVVVVVVVTVVVVAVDVVDAVVVVVAGGSGVGSGSNPEFSKLDLILCWYGRDIIRAQQA